MKKTSIFITQWEEERLRTAAAESMQQLFYKALKARTEKNTVKECLVQPGDTQEWYHLCWERISDAAFVWHMEKEERLGKWLHDRVMELAGMDVDQWIGPWYRDRKNELPVGALETAHITLAVCESADLCPELFSEEETLQITEAIREKGMLLCERFCRGVIERAQYINNWFMVLLNGFGTAAVLLGEQDKIDQAVEWALLAGTMYSGDDYAETVQYSNYASLHLSHLNELLIRSGYRTEELNLECYGGLMNWYAASFLYCKELEEGGDQYPRSFNFGDSAALFRPSGDFLAHVAVRRKEKVPSQAKLASWLLKQTYANPYLGPDELATFGFFNQYQYHTILMMPDMAEAASPQELHLPTTLSFSGGQVIVRDQWEHAKAAVAIQSGYQPYLAAGHRHLDQNSFQLAIGRERMLIDPGHCCYRLRTQQEAVSEMAHNTFSVKKDQQVIEQRKVGGCIFHKEDAGNKVLFRDTFEEFTISASDMAGLYEESILRAVRIFVIGLPHRMMVIDILEASEPVSLCTHFCANNRDHALKVHEASSQRLVLRRNGEALKLFCAYSETDGQQTEPKLTRDWTAMHAYYHPLENQDGQGKEGSVTRFSWEDEPGKEHIRIHTLLMDGSEEIKAWHVYPTEDGFIRMFSPGNREYLEVKVSNGGHLLTLQKQNSDGKKTSFEAHI